MKRLGVAALAAGLSPAPALAQEGAAETSYRPEVERRDGLMIGLAGGVGIGRHRGYPNTYEDIGDPQAEADTGVAFANGGSFFIGGALRDWVSVSVGSFGGSTTGNDLIGNGGAFGLRIEAYPLFPLGGVWENLGLGAEFGAGGATIANEQEQQQADGGVMSTLGIGAFLEAFSFWHVGTGPTVMYLHQYSQSLTSHALIVGWRNAVYWTLVH